MTEATAISKRPGRVVFIDQARALAIVLMLFGHSFDRFLAEPWRSGPAYTNYQFFRGISSALFILLAGFSFVVATFPKLDLYLRPSPKLWGRFRRIALILTLGFVLQMWAPTLSQSLASCSAAQLEHLFSYNVLQNIGTSLLLLHLILLITRTRRAFLIATGVVCLLSFAAAPLTYRAAVDQALPLPIAAMANLYHKSHFPLVPYAGFSLLGALLGMWYLWARDRQQDKQMMAIATGFGAVLISGELLLRGQGVELFPFITTQAHMPGFTFARAGTAMLILGGLYGLGRFVTVLPRPCKVISIDSLAIYFVHLFLVYGCATLPGLFPGLTLGMSPGQMWAWNLSLLLAMYLMAAMIGRLRTNRPVALTRARHFALLTLGINFLVAPHLHPTWISASAILALGFVYGAKPLAQLASCSIRLPVVKWLYAQRQNRQRAPH